MHAEEFRELSALLTVIFLLETTIIIMNYFYNNELFLPKTFF